MTDQIPHSITPPGGGVFQDLGFRIKLILKLMGDRRINPIIKILPIGSILYLLFPELIFGPILATPIDDAFVIWLATYLFVELCPDEVVAEHTKKLRKVIPADTETSNPPKDTLDGEFVDDPGTDGRPPLD